MSYALIIAEVRRGVFEERNLDAIGLCSLLGKESCLLVPDGPYEVNDKMVDAMVKADADEAVFLNPLNMFGITEKVFEKRGKPDFIIFTHSSSGAECAS
jgi:hypothetical protein